MSCFDKRSGVVANVILILYTYYMTSIMKANMQVILGVNMPVKIPESFVRVMNSQKSRAHDFQIDKSEKRRPPDLEASDSSQ